MLRGHRLLLSQLQRQVVDRLPPNSKAPCDFLHSFLQARALHGAPQSLFDIVTRCGLLLSGADKDHEFAKRRIRPDFLKHFVRASP